MSLVMEEEVRHVAGERHQQHEERRAHPWGKREDGYCVIDGQKGPIQRTRLEPKKSARLISSLLSMLLELASLPEQHGVLLCMRSYNGLN
jgi:hypothetical protein